MMNINVNGTDYTLSTSFGTMKKLETKFKFSITQIMAKLPDSFAEDLFNILAIGAGKQGDSEFDKAFSEDTNWDYSTLQLTVIEYLARMQYSGTPEEIETKLQKQMVPEEAKNAIRQMLNLPVPEKETT